MVFTVEDFQDLLALRALILSEELPRLPAEFRSFREEMEALRRKTEARFQRVEAQIAPLAEAIRRLTGRVEDLGRWLRGLVHEDRYRTRLRRYPRRVDNPHVPSPTKTMP